MTTLTDFYPTRQYGHHDTLIARRDPVIYANDEGLFPGPLSPGLLASFEERGYLCFPALLDKDRVAGLNRAADTLAIEIPRDDPRVVLEPGGEALRSIFAVHQISPLVAHLCTSQPLLNIARQLLGGDVTLHQTRLNYKPGYDGKEFYWHSDFETWHSEDGMPRMRAVSCVVALCDNYVHNGPLMIVPGSHTQFVVCPGETPEEHYKHSLRKQEVGVPSDEALAHLVGRGGIDTLTGQAGTVIFFDCNAMHGSNGNITPHPRNNLFFVYNHVANALVDPYCGRKPRPDHIAHRRGEVL